MENQSGSLWVVEAAFPFSSVIGRESSIPYFFPVFMSEEDARRVFPTSPVYRMDEDGVKYGTVVSEEKTDARR